MTEGCRQSHVVSEYNWFRLSDAERELFPEAAEIYSIEDSLSVLFEPKSDLLNRLPDMKAATLQGVLLKLSVAAASVFADENPKAHALLQSALQAILETAHHL